MKQRSSQIGNRYGKLRCVEELPPRITKSNKKQRRFRCICECGGEIVTILYSLRNGDTKSCGCLILKKKHGFTHDPLYRLWWGIKTRCYNPNTPTYHRYGGRGIIVHPDWLMSVEEFISYCRGMGYAKGLTIDRIDNNGNYEPGNIRFVTNSDNLKNREPTERHRKAAALNILNAVKVNNRPVICLETSEVYASRREAARAFGVTDSTIRQCIKKGYKCNGLHFAAHAEENSKEAK